MLAIQNAAPYKLVLPFFIGAVIFYLFSFINLLLTKDILTSMHSLEVAGSLHLYLLGFVMSTIFGAVYQLISVVLEVPLFSKKTGYLHMMLFFPSMILLSLSMIVPQYYALGAYAGGILYLSFLIYAINVLLSFKALKEWKLISYYIFIAHFLLLTGVSFGIMMLGMIHFGWCACDLHTMIVQHAQFTLMGFVFLIVISVGTVLLPMFMLSHNWKENIAEILLAVSLLSIVISYVSVEAGYVMFASALLLLVWMFYDIYRKRVRKIQDVYSYEMIASMVILTLSALGFLSQQTEMIYFAMALLVFGFLSFFLGGHFYKIIPFLVWNEKFAPLVGKEKVPMLADMVNDRLAYIEIFIKVIASLVVVSGVVLKNELVLHIGLGIFVINALFLVLNVVSIFRFKGVAQ